MSGAPGRGSPRGRGPARAGYAEWCDEPRVLRGQNVRKLVASSVRVARAGNGILLEANGGYVVNLATTERMWVREDDGVYVVGVQLEDEPLASSFWTRDSVATCGPRVEVLGRIPKRFQGELEKGWWPRTDTPVEYHGQRHVWFRGVRSNSAEVSRACCVGHVVRPNSDGEEVKARWVCGQADESIEVELEDEMGNTSRMVLEVQKPSSAAPTHGRGRVAQFFCAQDIVFLFCGATRTSWSSESNCKEHIVWNNVLGLWCHFQIAPLIEDLLTE